jgi:hypothetical protein
MFLRTSLRYIPEDRTLHKHSCEKIKSYVFEPTLHFVQETFRYKSCCVQRDQQYRHVVSHRVLIVESCRYLVAT